MPYKERRVKQLRTQVGIVGAGPAGLLLGHLLHLEGIDLAFEGARHRIDMAEATNGRAIYVYGQNEVAKDLNAARRASGRSLTYGVDNVSVYGYHSQAP